jgi:predicted MFS family arabinose efflux permease
MFEQLSALARLDFSPRHQQPSWWRLVLATVASLAGSLIADALLVAVGEHVLHVSSKYQHFHLSDYGKLTVIGVIIACVAWPITTRITSHPRWMFFRMAIAVTLVLWLPDLYLFYLGQPPRAVAVLMCMHLAIALVTYNLLVHLAPVHPARREPGRGPAHGDHHDRAGDDHDRRKRPDQSGDYRTGPNRSGQY